MTEQDWLTSTDPAAMYIVVRERATEGQCKHLCRSAWHGVRHGRRSWNVFAAEMCEYHSDTLPIGVDLMREIFGNPFRPIPTVAIRCLYCEGRHTEPVKKSTWLTNCNGCFRVAAYQGEPQWLEVIKDWRNGLIPSTAQAIYDAERWSDLPLLADMLEEAGCAVLAILDHLRGREECPINYGKGWHTSPDYVSQKWNCEVCNGTGFRPVTHCRGCWALELFLEARRM